MFRPLSLSLALLMVLFSPVVAFAKHHPIQHYHAWSVAQATAAKSVTVWVNTNSGVYHYPGERWYGNTKEGKYISEAAARAEGDRPTENGQ